MITLPYTRWKLGDQVTVTPHEIEYAPFAATIIGMNWQPGQDQIEYTILEDLGGGRLSPSDGWTDDMFT